MKQGVNITWRSSGIGNIKIELNKGTVLKTVISASTSAATVFFQSVEAPKFCCPENSRQGTKAQRNPRTKRKN